MAASGSFLTNGWESGKDTVYLKFSYETQAVSAAGKETRIAWKLTGIRDTEQPVSAGGFKVAIDGETVYEKSADYRIALYDGTIISSGTKILKHDSDGKRSFTVGIAGAVSEYSVNCTGEATFTLDPISGGMRITSAGDTTLGKPCRVKWTPEAAALRYRLKFALGDWNHTTEAIHPNQTTEYIYTGYTIPVDVAQQLPSAKNGSMKVTLHAYSDSAATEAVEASDPVVFTVTVPEDNSTRPDVTMKLSPVSSLGPDFDGLYIQSKTKVRATLAATGKLGADISSMGIQVEGKRYGAETDYTSAFLASGGEIPVTGYATDSRGITGSISAYIPVIPYTKPRILADAYRCDADGNPADTGTYLNIEAMRAYSKVESGGEQKNHCRIEYRWKEDGIPWGEWETMLAADAAENDTETGAIGEGKLSPTVTYLVQVRSIDDIGEEAVTTITLPTDNVYMHRDGRRRSLSFGEMVEEDNTFATAADIAVRLKGNDVTIGGHQAEAVCLQSVDGTAGVICYKSGLTMQWGIASVTPTGANTPTARAVVFEKPYNAPPFVVANPVATTPGTTAACAAAIREDGFDIMLTASSITATDVGWLAIGFCDNLITGG